MRLRPATLLGLFALGAAGGLLGDQGHVASGTTRYLSVAHDVPFVWESPIWFPALVGLLTASIAELRVRIAPVHRSAAADAADRTADAVGAVAAVVGLYALTALVRHDALGPSTVVVYALAAIVWRVLGAGRPAALCGAVAAVVGVVAEIALVAAGVFEYADAIDTLAGVPPWLPGLYFAFGAVVSRLAELAATTDPAAAERLGSAA